MKNDCSGWWPLSCSRWRLRSPPPPRRRRPRSRRQGRDKSADKPSGGAAGRDGLNTCGCYAKGNGCVCTNKKAKCECPGECEPVGCDEKRNKEMEKEFADAVKRAQEDEKKREQAEAKKVQDEESKHRQAPEQENKPRAAKSRKPPPRPPKREDREAEEAREEGHAEEVGACKARQADDSTAAHPGRDRSAVGRDRSPGPPAGGVRAGVSLGSCRSRTRSRQPASRRPPRPSTHRALPEHRGVLIVLCGIVLPLITNLVELADAHVRGRLLRSAADAGPRVRRVHRAAGRRGVAVRAVAARRRAARGDDLRAGVRDGDRGGLRADLRAADAARACSRSCSWAWASCR